MIHLSYLHVLYHITFVRINVSGVNSKPTGTGVCAGPGKAVYCYIEAWIWCSKFGWKLVSFLWGENMANLEEGELEDGELLSSDEDGEGETASSEKVCSLT